jgi:hypothetical protein
VAIYLVDSLHSYHRERRALAEPAPADV